jgi:energy-coupling factor transporter ATP-binding protein EcfA2
MALALEGIGYRYAGASRPSLLGIDLAVADGEVVGVAGASDAGKSTLCLVLSGLAPRTIGGQVRGRVLLDGEQVDAWPIHRLSERIGICFQSPATQLSQVARTVFEEVAFGPMNLGIDRDEIVERTWSALDELRIADLAARDPLQLSGGQQQLVAICGLLALRPAHLILDEPTAQLDPEGTRLVGEAVAGLASRGASIVITEQKTDLLAAVCDRVVVLDAGSVAIEGPVDAVLADPALRSLGVDEPAAIRLTRLATEAGLGTDGIARLTAAIATELADG